MSRRQAKQLKWFHRLKRPDRTFAQFLSYLKDRPRHPSHWKPKGKWAAAFALAWVQVLISTGAGHFTQSQDVVLLTYLLPIPVQLAAFPTTRRTWWRWLVPLALAITMIPPGPSVTMLVAGTWIWHQVWFVESHYVADRSFATRYAVDERSLLTEDERPAKKKQKTEDVDKFETSRRTTKKKKR